jgi:hypothetical protein
MNHSFDIEVATKYGVTVAVFLNNIAHWTSVNMANRRNYNDGRYWIYNTRKAFIELFPYWTEDQLRTISKKAKKYDLLIESNYNKHKYDQTIWYSLTDKALNIYKLYPTPPNESDEIKNVENPSPDSFGKNTKSSPASLVKNTIPTKKPESTHIDKLLINNALQPAPSLSWEKSQMYLGKIPNAIGKNTKPIPNINPDGKTNTTTVAEQKLNTGKEFASEPVVVITSSLTTSSKPKADEPNDICSAEIPSIEKQVISKKNKITIDLQAIYRATPFVTKMIICEEDFIDAAFWMINNRGEIPERGKIKGIKSLVESGNFEGDKEWQQEIINKRNRAIGQAKQYEIERQMLTKSKPSENLEVMSPGEMVKKLTKSIEDKAKTEAYANKNKNKSYIFKGFPKMPIEKQEVTA